MDNVSLFSSPPNLDANLCVADVPWTVTVRGIYKLITYAILNALALISENATRLDPVHAIQELREKTTIILLGFSCKQTTAKKNWLSMVIDTNKQYLWHIVPKI